MLRRQYGTATPSSLAPVIHPEDAQPNEGINKRSYNLPPAIGNSSARGQATSINYRGSRGRGGYRGSNMNPGGRGGQRFQYAIRGNPGWRGRGRGVPGHSTWTPKVVEESAASSSASSSSGGTPRSPPRVETMDTEPSSYTTRGMPDLTFLNSSQTSATPPPVQNSHVSRNWMIRSRSPTPKLPAVPLKRRKVEEPLPLPSSSQMPPPTAVPTAISRLPLPGRARRPVETVKREVVSPSIKREAISPSPPPVPERKLITESCKYFPFPDNCRKSDPDYQQNRRSFFLEKNREIIRMGLKRNKAFARDDGLVIEWSSPVPVWSDTLQPEVMDLASAIRQTVQTNHKISSSKRPMSATSQGSQSSDGPSSSRSNVHRRPPSPKTIKKGGQSQITPSSTLNAQPGPKKRLTSTLEGSSSSDPKRRRRSASPKTMQLDPPSHTTPFQTSNSQPDSKKRLPLPGRKSLNPKPIAVPVAFSPRRSATPTSIPTPTLMSLMKYNDAAERRSSLSNNSSRRVSTPLTQTSTPNEIPDYHVTVNNTLDPDGLTSSMRKEEEDTSLTILHSFEQTETTPITSIPHNTAPGTTNHPTQISNDTLMLDNDSRDAEDVATSLLRPTRDTLPSKEEAEIDDSTDDDSSEIEGLVSDYLLRYCQLFDSDRSKLEMAYDRNALFSCRVHHQEEPSFSMAGLFAPEVKNSFRSLHSRASASTVDQGRTQISNRLLSMGPYQFCPRGVTGHLLYDAVDSAAGVLLTVHGEVVNPHISNPQLDHVLTLDQSFVLRQRNMDVPVEEEGSSVNGHQQDTLSQWPLVAISHQMTVRAAPLLSTERLEEDLPWIRDISP